MKTNIHELIKDAEDEYVDGDVKMGKYVSWKMYEVIERISAYLNSTHTSGSTDSLGREKPFFNIVSAAVNIWYRATDIDRKDINVRPSKSKDTFLSFVATIYLREWMKKSRFGVFLNQWGRTLSQYGSAVVKFVKQDGELVASVIPWNRLVVDAVDFDALPVIEVLFKTPAQLRKMKEYDQEVVESLLDAETTRKNLDGTSQDTTSKFVKIYEVHGELPLSLLTDKDSDEDTYRQQMHVVSFIGDGNVDKDKFTLYKGKEEKNPYMITHLIEEDGRTLSIGAVEYLFDAQWMLNHTVKNLKDTLDLASRLIFQTSDAKFQSQNVLSAIETGDIMIHSQNEPLTQINNSNADVSALMNFSGMWRDLGQEITATPDSMRGVTPPSGTPYSTTALITGQSNSLFELMTENKGLALQDMMVEYVIPFLKQKMKSDKEELIATLEDHDVQKVDAMYIPKKAIRQHNERFKNDVLSGREPTPFNQVAEEASIKQELAPMGNQRSFDPKDINWGKLFENIEWKLDFEITNESKDKQMVLSNLVAALQTIAGFAGRQMSPNEQLVFNKIMSESGAVSPLELSIASGSPQPQMQPQPQQQPQQAVGQLQGLIK